MGDWQTTAESIFALLGTLINRLALLWKKP